jgi:dipeptidyl aminopeptidase/acylaminoacyl peptidase
MKFPRSCLLLFAFVSNTVLGAEPPITAFVSYAQIESLQISPDGKLLAVTKRSDKFELLSVLRYPDLSLVGQANFGDLIDIQSFVWANNSRLLVQPARRFLGYRAHKVPTGEIFGVDANNGKADILFGFNAGKQTKVGLTATAEAKNMWAEIVDTLADDENSVLIQTGSYDPKYNSSSLQRMNVRTGALSRVAGSPINDPWFAIDSKKQPAFATGENPAGDMQTYRFKPADKSWELLNTSKADTQGYILPIAVTDSPDEFLALDSLTSSTKQLVTWNPTTNARKTLFHSENSDVRVAGIDPDGRIWLYSYIDHYPEYWYPDPEHPLARAHRALRATFKDANIYFTSETRDMSMAVAEVSAPRTPPVFYLLDVKNVKVLQRLPSRPDLKTEDLSPTDPIEVKVRDGVKIRGYLTTPNGKSKNLPMIVLVHGGPHGPFDDYDFNYEPQLLASRGYAVLQVNYRGSGGRGREFMVSGYRRWGLEMQNDITDAVKWAIGYGVADRNRICIYGASYGAYAALTGAYREPDMFKCAVGLAGVYDLPLMFNRGDIKDLKSGVRYLNDILGNDEADLRERSPVYNAEKIKAAVFLIHGKEDERAPFEHAKRMREALQKAGNPPEWLSEGGEAHGIFNEDHRAHVYELMLQFFAKHIGRASEPAPPPAAKN